MQKLLYTLAPPLPLGTSPFALTELLCPELISFAHQIKPNSRPFLCIFFHQQSKGKVSVGCGGGKQGTMYR